VVRIEFTMPEALTQWRFMGFAHDRQLRSGFLTDTVVMALPYLMEYPYECSDQTACGRGTPAVGAMSTSPCT